MGYTPTFQPMYEDGWEDLPLETTPIQAEALNNYDEAIEHIEDYLASDESQANLADAYDATETYSEGDYRIHNGTLYKCLEDIDEPEEWDSTKWESCLITDEMATSGGTTVIANPSGEATETLTKLQVENTIYGISGGGGNANIWTGTQAELEEVFDELEEGTQINITDDEQEVVEGGTIYSEDEQVIGLWIDNKPLYQRTYTWTGEIIPNGYTVLDANLLSNVINNLTLVSAEYKASSTSGGTILPNVYTNSIGGKIVEVSTNDTIGLYIENLTTTYIRQAKVTIQYTKVSDAPLDVVVGKSTMYIASSDCYSTEEKEVGCWTDGKPLYQRTLVIDNVTQTQNTTVDLATLSDIDHIQVIGATGFESGIVYAIPEFSDRIQFKVSTGKLQSTVPANAGWANATLSITIQYTKTTDTAGSGQYTPASGKAVHYSTDEQVIGTWIDGSTIYRKTVNTGSLPNNTDKSVAHGISNLSRVINVCGNAKNTTVNYYIPLPYLQTDVTYQVAIYCDNTNIHLVTSRDTSGYNESYVTIEYTKATS